VPDNVSLQTLQNVGFAWEHEYIYQLWAPDSLSNRSDCCKNKQNDPVNSYTHQSNTIK